MEGAADRNNAVLRLKGRLLAWFSKPANIILLVFLIVVGWCYLALAERIGKKS